MVARCGKIDGLIRLLDFVYKRCGGKGAGVCSIVTNPNAVGVHDGFEGKLRVEGFLSICALLEVSEDKS